MTVDQDWTSHVGGVGRMRIPAGTPRVFVSEDVFWEEEWDERCREQMYHCKLM